MLQKKTSSIETSMHDNICHCIMVAQITSLGGWDSGFRKFSVDFYTYEVILLAAL